MGEIRAGPAASELGAVEAPGEHAGHTTIVRIATPSHQMTTDSLFWAEIQWPDGTQFRVEARSYRSIVSRIRFFATVENARLLARGPIPENVTSCTRCRDLFTQEKGSQ